MKVWRVDSSIYDSGCSELFATEEEAWDEVARIKKSYTNPKISVTQCEDIWDWHAYYMDRYVHDLLNSYADKIDDNNWYHLTLNGADLYAKLDKLFANASIIDEYSILMERISETDDGQIYALAVSWILESEIYHLMEVVVI